MTEFRRVTDRFAVSPQITPADVAEAAEQGFVMIINNRPDGEAPGQPAGREIASAAGAAGVAYAHIPIVGRPSDDQVAAMRDAVDASPGKVLAFCRSGTRSITAWALGRPDDRETLIAVGAAAGYELAGSLPG
jgi:uncharacterized protein (TIGR01244 family)